jgi:Carboxypeptidase regulatory-like domain
MKSLSIGLIGLFAFSFNAWSATPALEGIVKAPDGKPIKSAQLKIEAKSGKFVKTVTTDAKGHYYCDGLTTGADYKVTLLVNGSVKASILNTKIQPGNPTQLSFNLTKEKGSAKHHMVWVPQETGSHIGSTDGHWVEVDDQGRVVGSDNPEIIKAGKDYANQLQNSGARPKPGN